MRQVDTIVVIDLDQHRFTTRIIDSTGHRRERERVTEYCLTGLNTGRL